MGSFKESMREDRSSGSKKKGIEKAAGYCGSMGKKLEEPAEYCDSMGKKPEKPAGGKAEGTCLEGRRLTRVLREEGGMITVYLSLVFMLLMAVSFCVVEGVRDYQLSSLEEDAFISGGRAALANYDKELYSHYQLFFMDPRERSWLETEAREAMNKRFLQDSFYAASCRNLTLSGQVWATDCQGKVLHQQIRELMKYEPVGVAAEKLTTYLGRLQEVDYDSSREKVEEVEEKEDQAKSSQGDQVVQSGQQAQTDTKEVKKWKALKKTISGIINMGILSYVVDKPGNISHARLPASGLPSHMDGQGGRTSVSLPVMSFSGITYLSGYFSHNPAEDYRGNVPLEDMMDIAYACSHFNSFGKRVNKDSLLQYEMEYLCIGRNSDLDNLKGTVRRIMLIRYACNFSFACSDPSIGQEAETLAALLAGAIGMPQLASTVKMLYIGALSYGETLLDLHSLLAGGKVPLIKSAGSWNLNLMNASEKLSSKSMVKPGKYNIDYENYLQLLLLMQRKRARLLYRMMDLMQTNVRQKEAGFFMKDCLFSFRLQGSFCGAKWFPLIPGMGLVSDKIMETRICRIFSY